MDNLSPVRRLSLGQQAIFRRSFNAEDAFERNYSRANYYGLRLQDYIDDLTCNETDPDKLEMIADYLECVCGGMEQFINVLPKD